MIRKRVFGAITAAAMILTAVPMLTAAQPEEVSTLSATAADGYTVPDLNITGKSIPDLDCFKFVAEMGAGINLGNTFDATNDNVAAGANLDIESAWVGVKTTKPMIDAMKKAGFNTLRIPVSWHNHVDSNFQINTEWLNRVQEVVDYAFANDMHVILNIHHDNSTSFMFPDTSHLDNSKKYVGTVWTQLAEKFKDYDEKLIFETLNEPRLVGSTYEWWYTSSASECTQAQDCVNQYNQTAVDAIRKVGGKNANRYIMVPAYCAKSQSAIANEFKLPTDSATNRIILSVHEYIPYNFAMAEDGQNGSTSSFDMNGAGGTEISNLMDTLYIKFISKNVPVVIGEFGARNKNENTQARVDYTAFYYAAARARGISCCWWDNQTNITYGGEGFGLLDRNSCTWRYPSIVEAAAKYGNGDGQSYVIPSIGDVTGDKADILPDGTITFPSAVGDKIMLEINMADNCAFANGCLAFTVSVDGVNYWVSYMWQSKTSGQILVDLTDPFQALDNSKTDASGNAVPVEDEATLARVIAAVAASSTASLQNWYSGDTNEQEIKPATDGAQIISAMVFSGSTTTTTETTTTTTTTTTGLTNLKGDVDGNGKVDIADVVRLARYVSQDSSLSALTAEQLKSADFNGDTAIDASDISAMTNFLSGIA